MDSRGYIAKNDKKSIGYIAMDLNFSSQQAFTRSFSREFKISPLKFRRQRYFDCSYLMPSLMINPYTYKVYQTHLPPLKLIGHNFLLKEGLLEKSTTYKQD
ncbi:TPA: helix-turn-helix domain-containing protein [Escherichia coli]|nr:helix-turn-helix transcriptional regulator [Escherichia coli]